MPNLLEATEEETLEFTWGRKRSVGGPNNSVQFYDSFTYDGVEYFLYDCVYMWADDQTEPYIGKLVKIWETASHKKKAKVVWFFRPVEIKHWLGETKLLKSEIFLANGEGKGLFNLNLLEAISGKCKVVCASKDPRNAQPTEEDLRKADYVFFRTFDVSTCKVSTKFADEIAGVEVKHYFNWRKIGQSSLNTEYKANLKAKTETFYSFPASGVTTAVGAVEDGQSEKFPTKDSKVSAINLDEETSHLRDRTTTRAGQSGGNTSTVHRGTANLMKETNIPMKYGSSSTEKMKYAVSSYTGMPDIPALKKRKLQVFLGEATGAKPLSGSSEYIEKFVNAKDPFCKSRCLSKGVNTDKEPGKGTYQSGQDEDMKGDGQIVEVTRRLHTDSSNKWFKLQSWDDKMKAAHEKGTLVLLENLDPSYTSAEVEEIVSCAFNQQVSAKIQHSKFSSPNYGKAFVIFNSKDAADASIFELRKRCLILGGGRPVVGCRGKLGDPCNPLKFFGHLAVPKDRLTKQHEDKRNAVSTSHYSQSNTVEYEMAMEWCGLHERSKLWWEALHKAQTEEIEVLKKQIKVHHKE